MLGAGAVGSDHLLLAATAQKDEVRAALESVEVREENVRKLLRSRSGKNSSGASVKSRKPSKFQYTGLQTLGCTDSGIPSSCG